MLPNRALGLRTVAAVANAPYWELLRGTTPPVRTPMVFEVSVQLVTGVQTEIGLFKTSSVGTPNPSVLMNKLVDLGVGIGDISNTRCAVAWSALPTIGLTTTALQRVVLPGSVGAAAIWNFDGALEIQAGESLVLWNLGAAPGGILDVNCSIYGT